MPAETISMRKLKEVIRLRYSSHLSIQQIAASLNLSKSTVSKYIKLAQEAGLSESSEEGDLRALFNNEALPWARLQQPDFSYLHNELKRKGVTLQLLWEEYSSANPTKAYSYSRFCELYQQWRGKLKISLRQTHRAGEKMFVDYAGQTVPVIDSETGTQRQAQIFVAVLGASNYAYAEATWTQSLPDWIASHVRTFAFFGGVTEIIVPDNTRCAVSKACLYEPDINPTYSEMASYYGTAVIPARPYKPKDKAKVELGVLLVERWILARLRNRRFFSLAELNAAVSELLADYNGREFKRLPGTRRRQFETLDKPSLKPLPAVAFEYAEWKKKRVGLDYHVEVDGHYYSVPHSLVKKEVELRITSAVVEALYHGKRVASHARSYERGAQTTLFEHMPKAHQKYLEWTPKRLFEWSQTVGPLTHQVVVHLLENKPHPEQGYRSCRGLLSLARRYGTERLENACRRALAIGSPSYKSAASILKVGLDLLPEMEQEPMSLSLSNHENVRGPDYYRSTEHELIN